METTENSVVVAQYYMKATHNMNKAHKVQSEMHIAGMDDYQKISGMGVLALQGG